MSFNPASPSVPDNPRLDAAPPCAANDGALYQLTARERHLRAALRSLRSGLWRDVRRRLYALPFHIRAYVKLQWSRSPGRRDPLELDQLLRHAAAQLGAAASDYDHLDGPTRAQLTAELNLLALRGLASANASFFHSPAVAQWLNPDDVGAATPLPRSGPQAVFLRAHSLTRSLSHYAAKPPASTASTEHAAGLVTASGADFQFSIHYLRPIGNSPSPTPWNADLCRRIVFIREPGDHTPLEDFLPDDEGPG